MAKPYPIWQATDIRVFLQMPPRSRYCYHRIDVKLKTCVALREGAYLIGEVLQVPCPDDQYGKEHQGNK